MRRKTQDGLQIKGQQTITLYDMAVKGAMELQAKIEAIIKNPFGNAKEYRYLVNQLKQLCAEREFVVNNIVNLRGKQIIAERLAGTNTYTLNVSHGAVGTGTTAVAAGDTQLATEYFRKALSSSDISNVANGIVILSFFYSTTDFVNSAIKEFGSFIDGSASANSGRILNHVLFAETINKTALKTLTVDAQFTIT